MIPTPGSTIRVKRATLTVTDVSPLNASAGLVGLVGAQGRTMCATYDLTLHPGQLLCGRLGKGWQAWVGA